MLNPGIPAPEFPEDLGKTWTHYSKSRFGPARFLYNLRQTGVLALDASNELVRRMEMRRVHLLRSHWRGEFQLGIHADWRDVRVQGVALSRS